MSINPVSKTLLILCGFAVVSLSHGQLKNNEWDRPDAMAAVQSVNIDAAVYAIGDFSTLNDADATLKNLGALENRADWPLPAREAALFQFTQSLAELPRDAVATEVMQHLETYQAQTLVAHEDHPESLVPLFNIRGAAAGVENGWQRTEFAGQAVALIEKDPSALVSSYLGASNHNQRYGYLDALQQAGMADVLIVQDIALQQFEEQSELTGLLGVTAAISGDTVAIQQLLTLGRGVGLSSVLVQLENQLPLSEIASLLVFSIQQVPANNATLAIAAWWPRLSHNPEIRDLMVATLSDPELGASAALALAQGPDIQTIRILQDMAGGDSIAAHRAQMALDLNRDGLTMEVRP